MHTDEICIVSLPIQNPFSKIQHHEILYIFQPLRLNNVDENIAREIDDDLTKEYEKEEIMRKTFWKARQRAKEELTRQLADFQQKRTAGLGTIYGPTDQELMVRFLKKESFKYN